MPKFKAFLTKGNHAQWYVFVLFASAVLIKAVLFHWNCYHSVLISSLWKHPSAFFCFWVGKLIPAIFLASFIFVSRKSWWTTIVNCVIDIWLIANVFYYKANVMFLSYEVMKMADNMNGFWSSLHSYLGWDIFAYIGFSALYIILWLPVKKVSNTPSVLKFICMCGISILLSIVNNICYVSVMNLWKNTTETTAKVHSQMLSNEKFQHFYPFGHAVYWASIEKSMDYNAWADAYVHDYSIISYFPAMFVFNAYRPAGEKIMLTIEDMKRVEPFVSKQSDSIVPNSNLIFILFESLESWTLNKVCGYEYMPNLTKLSQSAHTLHCNKIKSQVRHGNSADGQMLGVTGMLPISNGAVCRLYADNQFAGYAECYKNAAVVNPSPGTWGQSKMTFAYHFKELIEPKKGQSWGDLDVMKQIVNYADSAHNPFCVLGITIASHVPFTYGSKYPKYTVEGMPMIMSAYLNSLNYTDSCIGELMRVVSSNEKLKNNTTIVISGDHTIFRSRQEDFDTFAKENGINMQTTKTFTSLLIYSPQIDENIQITDTCFQMDIYPTIMHLIGCEDYYWKGFGVNLLDSVARHNRPISEQEAFELSDKLIRSNYFSLLLSR